MNQKNIRQVGVYSSDIYVRPVSTNITTQFLKITKAHNCLCAFKNHKGGRVI